ncbi:hypothetical protein GCM10011492_02090 [Flexivirga endophytica]|uniref:Septum formation-related domain-containing protein n=1 Tax=Flexivirga endophytica TaxID=1849103 RepID=A0A916STN7_9MICO|nr:septum formation family protein [Flexivirga endophytica]GGB15959.1 hypothetical protein GCM10011492_02090 [Flexivirga endophytica]GHB39638.1 hypothetical protein GCM10008112_05520 [Flexivirga endophytica]
MARRSLGLAAAALAVGVLAGCGSDGSVAVTTDRPPVASTGSSAGSASTSSPAEDYLQGITVGDCLDQPAGEWKSGDCAKGHEFEVSAIVPSKWDKHDAVARSALRTWTCNEVAAAYLGGPIVATFFQAVPLPTAADPKSADRIVCLTHQSAPDEKIVQTFGPMRGQLSDPEKLASRRVCLAEVTTHSGTAEPVRCSQEHASEAVTDLSLGKLTDPYPEEKALRATMRKVCTPEVREHLGGVERKDLVVGALGPSESQWNAGDHDATCFVNIKGDKLTKSVKDIKTKPLKDYR